MPKMDVKDTILEAIGIEVIEVREEKVVARMPVHGPTKQPFGVLHGGASVVLAETVASIGTFNLVDQEKELAVGLEINANHVRGKERGRGYRYRCAITSGTQDHGLGYPNNR